MLLNLDSSVFQKKNIKPITAITNGDLARGINDQNEFYEANTIPVASEKMFVLPIHQRNTNFRMAMRSTSPFPVVISSLRWEGQYMPRNYRRQ